MKIWIGYEYTCRIENFYKYHAKGLTILKLEEDM